MVSDELRLSRQIVRISLNYAGSVVLVMSLFDLNNKISYGKEGVGLFKIDEICEQYKLTKLTWNQDDLKYSVCQVCKTTLALVYGSILSNVLFLFLSLFYKTKDNMFEIINYMVDRNHSEGITMFVIITNFLLQVLKVLWSGFIIGLNNELDKLNLPHCDSTQPPFPLFNPEGCKNGPTYLTLFILSVLHLVFNFFTGCYFQCGGPEDYDLICSCVKPSGGSRAYYDDVRIESMINTRESFLHSDD